MPENATQIDIRYVSIANLPGTTYDAVDPSSKLAIEIYKSSTGTYSSHSISAGALISGLYDKGFKKILEDVYGLNSDQNFANACNYVNSLSSKLDVTNLSFGILPSYNNSTFITDNLLNDTLSSGTNYVSISKDSKFTTKYTNLENSAAASINIIDDISQAPATDTDKHNRYIFKVTRHTSNVYDCEKSGWFFCYGWLSEKETYFAESSSSKGSGRQDNSKRWVALEGEMNNEWKILQLQPVMPGNYCNYVSFSLPVRSGLKLQITTGFDVGNNSGKWSNVPGSLTNHIPNAFIGGIYA